MYSPGSPTVVRIGIWKIILILSDPECFHLYGDGEMFSSFFSVTDSWIVFSSLGQCVRFVGCRLFCV